MKESQQAAVVAELVRKLRSNDSWAGETHVQKTAYFLEQLLDVPLGFRFTLYKYGPFSFDLRDLLTQMRTFEQLQLEPQPRPYGPRLAVGASAEQLKTRFPTTLERYDGALRFVAREIGPLGVGSLERLATALMVTREAPQADADERAALLHRYKPHVPLAEAREAVVNVDKLADKATATLR